VDRNCQPLSGCAFTSALGRARFEGLTVTGGESPTGGGIEADAVVYGQNADLTIIDTTIEGNRGTLQGGGLHHQPEHHQGLRRRHLGGHGHPRPGGHRGLWQRRQRLPLLGGRWPVLPGEGLMGCTDSTSTAAYGDDVSFTGSGRC
jgi:hypothetical protein